MNKQNNFKSALVTGTSKGIGLELVTRILENNKIEKVFAGARSRSQELEKLQNKYPERLEILEMDVSDPKSVSRCFEEVRKKIQSLDLLINNAGIIGEELDRSVLKVTSSDFLDVFNTDVCGALNVTNTFFPLFSKDYKTLVLNISSNLSSITKTDDTNYFAYRVAKCGLNMLNRCYSLELGKKANFVAMHPGWLDSDMGRVGGKEAPTSVEEGVGKILKQVYSIGDDFNGRLIDNEGKDLPW